ncbi:MAG: preprotein translocase subunit YajC [Mariprofundaceae bacterium]|nr:preprotein translocase subunit YajC [Mariprofundaceae bacterium]
MNNIIRSIFTSIAALLAFSTPAFAEGGASASSFTQLIPLVLIMVIFWFLLIRPQQKRAKEHRSMVEGLKKGDKVLTNGGIFGTITDVKDDFLKVEIADNIRIKIQRDAVSSLSD